MCGGGAYILTYNHFFLRRRCKAHRSKKPATRTEVINSILFKFSSYNLDFFNKPGEPEQQQQHRYRGSVDSKDDLTHIFTLTQYGLLWGNCPFPIIKHTRINKSKIQSGKRFSKGYRSAHFRGNMLKVRGVLPSFVPHLSHCKWANVD